MANGVVYVGSDWNGRTPTVYALPGAKFDLERGVWTKPSHNTKQNRVEHVPLNDQAVAFLKSPSHDGDYLNCSVAVLWGIEPPEVYVAGNLQRLEIEWRLYCWPGLTLATLTPLGPAVKTSP